MERTARDTLVALLVGSGISGGLYWLIGYISLAVTAGLCWVIGLKLSLYVRYLNPAFDMGDTWSSNRWPVLAIGLLNFAALIGVSPMLPISDKLRLGLGFLVIGAGLVAYSAGTLAVLERIEYDSETTILSNPETPSSTDGD
jgi:uncharacterized BrkB/YihY/UPF0761 family membrane protein